MDTDLIECLQQIVTYVDQACPRVRWDNDRIARSHAQRNANQIRQEGDTFYMHPCLDLTVLAHQAMIEAELRPWMYVDTRQWRNKPEQRNSHVYLEGIWERRLFYLDFQTLNVVSSGLGPCVNVREELDVLCTRALPIDIDHTKPIMPLVLAALNLPEGSYEPVIARMQRDNTDERHAAYMHSIASTPGLSLHVRNERATQKG